MAEPNGYIQGADGVPLELVDATARRQLAGKLDAPGGVKAGDYLRVKSVGEDGTVVVEGAEAPGGGSGQNPSQGADLTDVQTILRNVMIIIRAQVEDETGTPQAYSMDISGLVAECDALIAGLTGSGGEVPEEPEQPEKTLVSISAAYSGGEVAVGTALTELVGITVTAAYSDGSTETVTGYTLSGEIAEGSNAITVSYGGKTATITVVGVASGDDEPADIVGVFCPPMCKIGDWNNLVWPDAGNEFTYTSNINGSQSVYEAAGLPGSSFMRDWLLRGPVWIRILTNEQYGVVPNCFSVYANADGTVETGGFEKVSATIYRQFGGKTQTMDVNGKTYYFMLFKFDIPVGMVGRLLSVPAAMKSGHFISADRLGIDAAYKPYYTMFDFDPSDRITEPATEVA